MTYNEEPIEELYGNVERASIKIFPETFGKGQNLESLAAKFRRAGVADPVEVDEYYQIIGNENNLIAARMAGLKNVPVHKKKAPKSFSDFPNRFLVELSNKCNLECIMCPAHGPTKDMKREKLNMSFDLFKKVIDEISSYQRVDLLFHFYGEPLLNPDLIKMFEYLKQKKTLGHLLMSTNGTILNDRYVDVILDSPLHVLQVSMNALNAETYEQVTGGREQERVARNVEAFISAKIRRGKKSPLLRVQMVEMDCNDAEIAGFIQKWEGVADLIHVNKFEKQGGRVVDQRTKEDYIPKNRFFCDRLRRKDFVIYSNGIVSACVYDYDGFLKLGDANCESLASCANSIRYQELIKAHQDQELDEYPICASCTDWML